jgi:hypothetical protein
MRGSWLGRLGSSRVIFKRVKEREDGKCERKRKGSEWKKRGER